MNLIEGLQDLMSQVPLLVQPLLVALAAAIPFIEGELAAVLGVWAGLNPFVAFLAAAAGNFLSVFVVVVFGARIREIDHNASSQAPRTGADWSGSGQRACPAGGAQARIEGPPALSPLPRPLRRSRREPPRPSRPADAVHVRDARSRGRLEKLDTPVASGRDHLVDRLRNRPHRGRSHTALRVTDAHHAAILVAEQALMLTSSSGGMGPVRDRLVAVLRDVSRSHCPSCRRTMRYTAARPTLNSSAARQSCVGRPGHSRRRTHRIPQRTNR